MMRTLKTERAHTMTHEAAITRDSFIGGRLVIHRHAKLLVTDNRIVWEQVGPNDAVCAAVPSGDLDLADFGVVLAEAEAFRDRRVEKTVEIVTKVRTADALRPVNGARRRILIRKAEELKRLGNHQIAAAHYVVAGLGLLARKELETAAAILASQGEADRAKRCMESAGEIDPIWNEERPSECDDIGRVLSKEGNRIGQEGLSGTPDDQATRTE
jgi:hypothetical protein